MLSEVCWITLLFRRFGRNAVHTPAQDKSPSVYCFSHHPIKLHIGGLTAASNEVHAARDHDEGANNEREPSHPSDPRAQECWPREER